jgi:hypothetical protein
MKRTFDLLASVVAHFPVMPLMFIILLAISHGPTRTMIK